MSGSSVKSYGSGYAFFVVLVVLFVSCFLTGCGSGDRVIEIDDVIVPLAGNFVIPVADSPGIMMVSNERVFIDYSYISDGYVTVFFTGESEMMLKVLVTGPAGNMYIFELQQDKIEVLPLSEGDGLYTIGVYEHMFDEEFAEVLIVSVDVELAYESVPFIRPNQYVSYDRNSIVVDKTVEITDGVECFFQTIEAVLIYFDENVFYDAEIAESVGYGFLPDIDAVIKYGRGFCFDIAAAAAAMLRCRGIPAQLAVGYYNDEQYGQVYHAWVNVYSEIDGTVGGVVNIEAGRWNVIDPTFVSSMGIKLAAGVTGDGSDYKVMFIY